MKSAGIVLTILVLVCVPLGVFIVPRETAPTHHVSRLALVAERLTANLEQYGDRCSVRLDRVPERADPGHV